MVSSNKKITDLNLVMELLVSNFNMRDSLICACLYVLDDTVSSWCPSAIWPITANIDSLPYGEMPVEQNKVSFHHNLLKHKSKDMADIFMESSSYR